MAQETNEIEVTEDMIETARKEAISIITYHLSCIWADHHPSEVSDQAESFVDRVIDVFVERRILPAFE